MGIRKIIIAFQPLKKSNNLSKMVAIDPQGKLFFHQTIVIFGFNINQFISILKKNSLQEGGNILKLANFFMARFSLFDLLEMIFQFEF